MLALLPLCAGAAEVSPVHPEKQLLAALNDMQAGRLDVALSSLDQLVRERPTFRLAQLFYSQLLSSRAGGGSVAMDSDNPEFVELIEEARLRLQRWSDEIPDDAVPSNILQLSAQHKYAILVDLQRARLYLIENQGGEPKVIRHFYAAMGKLGAGKEVSGDQRTPIGVYHVTDWLPGEGLPDLYGAGAFPVNYPNAWDHRLGRTGSGIWLHGVPSDTYTRAPLSSQGCVTMANDDLMWLKPYIKTGSTPVILARSVEWVDQQQARAERDALLAKIEDWRSRWAALDTDAYLAYYDDEFTSGGMSLISFAAHKRRVNSAKKYVKVQLKNLDLFRYPDQDDLVLAQFTQDYRSDNYTSRSQKQQFWRQAQDGDWRILLEQSY